MSNVSGLNVFLSGATISGANLDTNFANILTVANGNLRAENFAARAGIGLQHRVTKGNRFSVSGGTTQYTQAAGTGPTQTAVLLDVSAADLAGDIPAVYKIINIGANIDGLTGYTEPTGDEIDLDYRLYNTRETTSITAGWTAWATQIDSAVVWVAGTAQVSTAGGAVGVVIGEKDYERIQLLFNVTAAAGANIVMTGVSCWVTFEALHVP